MAFLDLGGVSRTLVKLLDETIKASPIWPPLQTPAVSGLPPDRLTGDNAVGIYLYHFSEDGAIRNQIWPGRPSAPIKFSPLALQLYYVLSAHSDLDVDQSPYREQLLMGLAAKALHDTPFIDENTRVGGVTILDSALMGAENRLRIAMRHVQANEAVSYWTAGSQPLRLCAYYEISIALIEPEEPPTGGGRVLTYGIQTFLSGLPRVDTSRSVVTFTVPGEATARKIEVQPAQVAPGDELVILGTGFSGGAVTLLVRRPGAPAPVEVDPAWGAYAGGDRVFATVQTTLAGEPLLPGAYTASVRVTRTLSLPGGGVRTLAQVSNETPFLVAPGIAAISAVAANGVFTMTGGPFMAAPVVPASEVRIYAGDALLVPGTAATLAPGEAAVVSATSIEARLPAGLAPAQSVPVRIVIRGSESAPRWVQVPV
jgi:hypothetical protein